MATISKDAKNCSELPRAKNFGVSSGVKNRSQESWNSLFLKYFRTKQQT